MARRRERERGQAASEYVALVLLVAVAFAALATLTAGGLGSHVLRAIQQALCTVGVGRCPAPVGPRADLAPCPVERRLRGEQLSETIAAVRLVSGGMLTIVRGSDGRTVVTLADESYLGADVGVGARLLAGQQSGAGARAGAGVGWSSGRSWTFPTMAAAERFVDRYGRKASIGGKMLDEVRGACSLVCDAIGWRPHPELPAPDETFEEGGPLAALAASLGAGGAGMRPRLEGRASLGRRIRRDGETTWYLAVGGGVVSSLRLPGSELVAAGQGRATLAYRVGADGRPRSLAVQLAVEGRGVGGLAGDVRRGGGGVGGALGSLRARLEGEGRGGAVELEATLDLTDAGNRAAARALLDALGGDVREVPARAAALGRRFAQLGQIDVRGYAVETTDASYGGEVALGAKLAGAFERSTRRLRLLAAATRLPGLPFLPRDDCRAAS